MINKNIIPDSFTNSLLKFPDVNLHRCLLMVFLLVLSVCTIIIPASAETDVSLSPANQSVELGSEVVVNVYVEPDMPISGAQFDLYFDGSVLDVKTKNQSCPINTNLFYSNQ